MTPDPAPTSSRGERRRRRDTGSTLPELIITVMMLGLIVTSLAAAVIVMVKQQANTKGRLNVSRSETSIGLWLPADLASAEDVDVTPGASPCGTSCPPGTQLGGSNTIMLSWDSLEAGVTDAIASRINVSYRYVKVGTEYQLVRVQCSQTGTGPWSCGNTIVLHNLSAPPPATNFVPGVTSPSWVIKVSEPLDPSSPIDDGSGTTTTTTPVDPSAPVKNAQRVIVTVNGGGTAAGAGGGVNTISLSAGGTTRTIIDSTSTAGTPTFNEARTRCGGNYGLIIDDSGSIGSGMASVIQGARAFVDAFAGTPIKIQVVRFDTTASVIGENPRSRYYDMLVDSDVTALRNLLGGLVANNSTNWEDALHRMFFQADGTVQQTLPDTVLFFTDGEPTVSRIEATSSPLAPTNPPARQTQLASSGTGSYDQEAFNRAKYIVDQFRSSVDFIGVGVGPAFNNSSTWLDYGPGWHYNYERGFHYEKRNSTSSSWYTVDKATYDAVTNANLKRIQYSSPYQYWESTTKAVYDVTSSSGRRRTQDYSPPYDSYDTVSSTVPNSTILTRLITGNDFGVPAQSVNGSYVNADVANMYLLPNWSQFTGALTAVALAECGGTVTIQTKVGSASANDPFEYQHTATTNSTGLPVTPSLEVVKTTRSYPSGTFDFAIPDGEYLTVEIQPMIPANTKYAPAGWSCKVGPNTKSIQTFPVNGGPWTGIRVQVRPNEAISCVMQVTR
ncbi:MAG: vWA domain-containing protein [Acidimicrobiales bacterium]